MFHIEASGPPQKHKTEWFATDVGSGKKFLIGYTVGYADGDGPHRGITQTRVLNRIPKIYYDRVASEIEYGLWAHFIWPTVYAESAGGHHLLVNTYDRARFTFGFYQLAAHTPDDNLIILFRKLLELPGAATYFPDLTLKSGLVHRVLADGKTTSLETVTLVTRPNGKVEKQIVGFMTYLNPDTQNVGEIEALNTAKLMHWMLSDPAAVSASVGTAVGIMKRKVKRSAKTYGLTGKPPELAIWVSDIVHQGRGSSGQIKAALAKQGLGSQLGALFAIGADNADYDGRRKTVRDCVAQLMKEKRFDGTMLGTGGLNLD